MRVNGERLWASIEAMAAIGGTEAGGVCRLTLSPEDGIARERFVGWCGELGLDVTVDVLGNTFARRAGTAPDEAPVVIGSHLDSQPTGGRFDGAYGVLAALEVIRTLEDEGVATRRPVEVVNWTNEEGARFVPAMAGSGAFAGVYGVDGILEQRDGAGLRFGDELDAIGWRGEAAVGGRSLAAYLELHIEQGPVLEAAGVPIGVVTGCLGVRWFDIVVTGQDAHAGPTPMEIRRDALQAAATIAHEIDRIGRSSPPHSRGTCGRFVVSPNSRNVVPGIAELSADFRHLEAAALEAMEDGLRRAVSEIAADYGTNVTIERVFEFPPAAFDDRCIDAIASSAAGLGLETMRLPTGAGHDAIHIARVAPTGMIFIPCRDGISHNASEYAEPEHVRGGADVMLQAVLQLAGQG